MFTLPTTVHQLVLSKLIVAVVWFLVTILAYVLCVFLAVVDNVVLRNMIEILRTMYESFSAHYAINGVAIVLEVLLLLVVATASSCLQFYRRPWSIGYGFTNHKGLWSVVFYFVISFVLQILSTIAMVGTDLIDFGEGILELTAMQAWHLGILAPPGAMLILSAVFYIITVLNLQKRLNLS